MTLEHVDELVLSPRGCIEATGHSRTIPSAEFDFNLFDFSIEPEWTPIEIIE